MLIIYKRYSAKLVLADILSALAVAIFVILADTSTAATAETKKAEPSLPRQLKNQFSSVQDFDPNVTEYWFDTRLDHFNFCPTTPATFPLRYLVNDQYYQNSSSPVLFYAGNEADIMQFVKNSGFLWEAANELGGMVVFAEHRYYGKSFPFGSPEAATTPSNISYLTVEQAMADYHTLQVYMRKKWNMSRDAAFIVAGGSYGGNLALWMRLKNPNLWAGALASSATPLKHLLRESNAFNKIVAEAYGNVSSECPRKVRQGWKELFEEVTTKAGRKHIQQELNLCMMPLDHQDDPRSTAWMIHGWISGALETMVQYGYPYPTNFYNPVPGYPFRVACENMLQENTGLGALRAAVQVYYNYTGQAGNCYDWFSSTKADDGASHWNRVGQVDRMDFKQIAATDRDWTGVAWGYQCCTEVYQPMPTNGITDFELPFQPNKTEYFENCRQRWEGVTPRPDWEEMTFMGDNIQAGSNIFLASGQLDPWRAAGIQSVPIGSHKSIIVRIIENGAHHYDLRSSHAMDTLSVVQVRQEELQAMRQWIREWKAIYRPSHVDVNNIIISDAKQS